MAYGKPDFKLITSQNTFISKEVNFGTKIKCYVSIMTLDT